MVVKRFTNLGLVGRGGGGGESEEEMGEEEGERGEAVVEESDLITDNLGHIGRYVHDAQSDKPIPGTAANRPVVRCPCDINDTTILHITIFWQIEHGPGKTTPLSKS